MGKEWAQEETKLEYQRPSDIVIKQLDELTKNGIIAGFIDYTADINPSHIHGVHFAVVPLEGDLILVKTVNSKTNAARDEKYFRGKGLNVSVVHVKTQSKKNYRSAKDIRNQLLSIIESEDSDDN